MYTISIVSSLGTGINELPNFNQLIAVLDTKNAMVVVSGLDDDADYHLLFDEVGDIKKIGDYSNFVTQVADYEFSYNDLIVKNLSIDIDSDNCPVYYFTIEC